jgi:hypothetical protein
MCAFGDQRRMLNVPKSRPLIGYKVLERTRRGNLQSPIFGSRCWWKLMEARSTRRRDDVNSVVDRQGAYGQGGFHVFKRRPDAVRWCGGVDGTIVLVRVRIWGRIAEHGTKNPYPGGKRRPAGWRAQHVMITHIYKR